MRGQKNRGVTASGGYSENCKLGCPEYEPIHGAAAGGVGGLNRRSPQNASSRVQNLVFYNATRFSDSPICRFVNGDKDLSKKFRVKQSAERLQEKY